MVIYIITIKALGVFAVAVDEINKKYIDLIGDSGSPWSHGYSEM